MLGAGREALGAVSPRRALLSRNGAWYTTGVFGKTIFCQPETFPALSAVRTQMKCWFVLTDVLLV